MSIPAILDDIIRREGHLYTNDPLDPGGPTRYGITLQTLADWRKPAPVTAEDVQNLSETEARAIYRARYITQPGYENIENEQLLALVVDTAVNCGQDRATKWLQAGLGVPADGVIGPATVGMLKACEPLVVYCFVLAERARHYARLYKQESQRKWAGGWTNRLAEFIEKAAKV